MKKKRSLALMCALDEATFKSTFMLLDVKGGRKTLERRLAGGEKITVLIQATFQKAGDGIEGPGGWQPWSRDDGESVEFAANVERVYEVDP